MWSLHVCGFIGAIVLLALSTFALTSVSIAIGNELKLRSTYVQVNAVVSEVIYSCTTNACEEPKITAIVYYNTSIFGGNAIRHFFFELDSPVSSTIEMWASPCYTTPDIDENCIFTPAGFRSEYPPGELVFEVGENGTNDMIFYGFFCVIFIAIMLIMLLLTYVAGGLIYLAAKECS